MMVQKHWEFGELESFAHIVRKGEVLLEGRNSKPGREKNIKFKNKEGKKIYFFLKEKRQFMIVWKTIFFKQKTAYEISLGLVGSEMCIRDRRGL